MIYVSQVPEDKIAMIVSPALLLKDYKNPVEIAGMKSSHVRDGLVVCQFLSRLEKEVTGGSTNWTELKAVEYLDNLRTKQKYNAGISFGTISAFGKNAASAHYQPTPETDTLIDTTQVYMLDSGGQYYGNIRITFHFDNHTFNYITIIFIRWYNRLHQNRSFWRT